MDPTSDDADDLRPFIAHEVGELEALPQRREAAGGIAFDDLEAARLGLIHHDDGPGLAGVDQFQGLVEILRGDAEDLVAQRHPAAFVPPMVRQFVHPGRWRNGVFRRRPRLLPQDLQTTEAVVDDHEVKQAVAVDVGGDRGPGLRADRKDVESVEPEEVAERRTLLPDCHRCRRGDGERGPEQDGGRGSDSCARHAFLRRDRREDRRSRRAVVEASRVTDSPAGVTTSRESRDVSRDV